MKQEWVCEVCGLSGTTEISDSAGAFDVVYAIEDHHDRLANQYAPHCKFDVHKVRVRNPDLMNVFAWNRFVASVERKLNVGL